MTEHTPLPWKCNIADATSALVSIPIQTPKGMILITADGLPKKGEMLANARFIVTACNCHTDLLEALKDLIDNECLDAYKDFPNHPVLKRSERAKAVVRKAEDTQ